MLIVKVYVNTEQIDEIMIHNEGCNERGWCLYHIEDHPEVGKIKHKRSCGYKRLLRDALTQLIHQDQINHTMSLMEHKLES